MHMINHEQERNKDNLYQGNHLRLAKTLSFTKQIGSLRNVGTWMNERVGQWVEKEQRKRNLVENERMGKM